MVYTLSQQTEYTICSIIVSFIVKNDAHEDAAYTHLRELKMGLRPLFFYPANKKGKLFLALLEDIKSRSFSL